MENKNAVGNLFKDYTLGDFKNTFENMISVVEEFKGKLEDAMSDIIRCQRNNFSDNYTFETYIKKHSLFTNVGQLTDYKWSTLLVSEYERLEQFMYSPKYTQLNQREKLLIDEFFTDMQIVNRIMNEVYTFSDLIFEYGFCKKERSVADFKKDVDTYINICKSVLIDYDLAHTSKDYQKIKDVENVKKVLDM